MIKSIHFFNTEDKLVKKTPVVKNGVFVAESAQVHGEVELNDDVSVWPNAVLRGDVMPIKIGAGTNIQDLSIIHGTFKQFGVSIGKEVTVGHGVTLHGCTIEDRCFIGMDSTVMDGVHIEKNCFVGAGSLLTPGKKFPEGSMIMGRPAKVVSELNESEYKELEDSYHRYVKYKNVYLENCKKKK